MMTPSGIPPYATSAIPQDANELTSIRQCARLLQVHFTTLARWIRETPSIQVRKIGAVHVVEPSQVRRELASKLAIYRAAKGAKAVTHSNHLFFHEVPIALPMEAPRSAPAVQTRVLAARCPLFARSHVPAMRGTLSHVHPSL